jgi:hypothetical protein
MPDDLSDHPGRTGHVPRWQVTGDRAPGCSKCGQFIQSLAASPDAPILARRPDRARGWFGEYGPGRSLYHPNGRDALALRGSRRRCACTAISTGEHRFHFLPGGI